MLKDYLEKQKQDSEQKIVVALGKEELTFGQLKKTTKLSSRTLSDRLIAMEEEGKVLRYVDTKSHPPRVNYSLTKEIKRKYGPLIDAYDRAVQRGKLDLIVAGKLASKEDAGSKKFKKFITYTNYGVANTFLSTMNDMLKAGVDEKNLPWFMSLTYYPRVNEVAKILYGVMLKNRKKSIQFLDKLVSNYNELSKRIEDEL